MTRPRRRGVLVLALVGSLAAFGGLGAGASARAADENDPVKSLGLHLVQDFRLKWGRSIPEFEAFAPGGSTGFDPWAVAEADASIPNRSGRLKLGLGVGRLGWNVDSTTIVEGTAARVKVRLGLDLGAGRLVLQLPDVKVTPRYEKGQLTFDWVMPIIEERF